MRIDPAGWPFVGIGFVIAALVAVAAGRTYGIAALVLPAFFLFFFRDPERKTALGPREVSRRARAAAAASSRETAELGA